MEDDNLHDILSCDLSKVVSCLKVGVTEDSFLDASKARDVVSQFESVDVTYTPQSVVGVLLGAIQQVEDLHLRTLSVIVSGFFEIEPTFFTGLGWSPALLQAMIKLEELKLSGCILSSD